MKKVLALAGSTSSTSINHQLVEYTADLLKDKADFRVIRLSECYPTPMFSEDEKKTNGIPAKITSLRFFMESFDGFMISLAEHNGAYSAAFKNVFDWLSILEGSVWLSKPVMLMGTSPGARGASSVLEAAKSRFPYNGASEIHGPFSLPLFQDNFKDGSVTNEEKKAELLALGQKFAAAL